MSDSLELGVATISVAFEDGKVEIGAEGEFYISVDEEHMSFLLNIPRIDLIKRLAAAEVGE